jgi:hypothetical protein
MFNHLSLLEISGDLLHKAVLNALYRVYKKVRYCTMVIKLKTTQNV